METKGLLTRKNELIAKCPLIKGFPAYDFTMLIKGDSMEPKYSGGDEVALSKVNNIIEWGKVYVLDTRDGAVLKRLYDANDKFRSLITPSTQTSKCLRLMCSACIK